MNHMPFEKAVKRNLSRSFRSTIIILTVLGILCGGNGLTQLIFGKGFSLGLFDRTVTAIIYIVLWFAFLYAASVIVRNGYKRGYALFLNQIDALGKREEVLARVESMPIREISARGAILRFDHWGLAYAYHETFAVLPCDRLIKTRISSKVRANDPQRIPVSTELVIEYKEDEELRIPVKDPEEAQSVIAELEKVFPRLNKV